jgi:hypothetical protein
MKAFTKTFGRGAALALISSAVAAGTGCAVDASSVPAPEKAARAPERSADGCLGPLGPDGRV